MAIGVGIGIGIEEQTATDHSLLIPQWMIYAQMNFRVRLRENYTTKKEKDTKLGGGGDNT